MNKNPPVSSQKSILINAPLDSVWALIVEVEKWPERYKHVAKAQMRGAFAVGQSFVWKSGGMRIVSTIQEVREKTFILWSGETLGTQAIHSWTLTAQGQDTLLETSESFDGWLVRLVPKMMQKMLEQTLEEWLRTIKKLAELK